MTGRHPCLACDLINAFRNVTSIRCVIVRLLIVNRSFHRTCFHTRLSVIETNDTWVCVYIYIYLALEHGKRISSQASLSIRLFLGPLDHLPIGNIFGYWKTQI